MTRYTFTLSKAKARFKEYAVWQVEPEIKMLENNGLKPNELKMAEMVIEENREIIVNSWKTFFGKK